MQIAKITTGQKTKKVSYGCALLMAAALFLISGCAARGAKRVPADRFDYNGAIAQSAREQMLMIELIFILSDREVIEVQQVEKDGKNERYLMIAEKIPE
jgi:hypothetical protein